MAVKDVVETLTFDEFDMKTLCRSVETLSGRLRIPAKTGGDIAYTAGQHGSTRAPGKFFGPGMLAFPLWVAGGDEDGGIPRDSTMRRSFFSNLDALLQLLSRDIIRITYGRPDGTKRFINGEVIEMVDFTTSSFSDPVGKVGVVMNCADPFWSSPNEITTQDYPWASTITLDEFKASNAPMEHVTMTMKFPSAGGGSVLTIGDAWGASVTQYRRLLGGARTTVIDGGSYTVTDNGVVTTDGDVAAIGRSSRWLSLNPAQRTGLAPRVNLQGTVAPATVSFTSALKFLSA